MGVMAIGIGLWVAFYLAGHRELDPISQGMAAATAVASLAFGGYVLLRRVRRGPQH
jgi:hypothetical protein